jgi:hypothetical protein
MFELFLSATFLRIGNNLDIAIPKGNKGNRPDIKITIDKLKYGVECKVLNSKQFNPFSFYRLIQKGSKQINLSQDIHYGFVLTNIINVIKHEDFMPAIKNGNNYEYQLIEENAITLKVQKMLDSMHSQFSSYKNQNNIELHHLFKDDKLIRMWIYYIITCALVKYEDKIGIYLYQNIESTNIIDSSDLQSEEAFKAYIRNKKLVDKISKSIH